MGIKDPERRREYQKEYYKNNSEKIKKQAKDFRDNNKERVSECRSITSKKYRVEKEYNISIEEYYSCMASSNKCQICSTTTNLVYDHNHITMKFRGVLCSRCNLGIGTLGDSEELLHKALKYIRGEV